MNWICGLVLSAMVLNAAPAAAGSSSTIPYFARRYGVSCAQCHATPPKLNAYGEAFRRSGYRAADLVARTTVPLAMWSSARADALADGAGVRRTRQVYGNRVELISGGRLTERLSYFVEWRALSQETRSDGTLRDRSGRFEDVYASVEVGGYTVTVGQFRQVDQVDVSLRLGLSEPLVLSASLPGGGGGGPREVSLRGFSPGGRSPTVRLARMQRLGGWEWTISAGVPFPGEFSLPLTREARAEASNELELSAKGVVIESFVRRGLWSAGGHVFYDHAERHVANLVGTGARGAVHWTMMAGIERRGEPALGRWSVEGEWVPHRLLGAGLRMEDRAGDGVARAIVPWVVASFPATRYTVRLTAERRLQSGRGATLVELGLVF